MASNDDCDLVALLDVAHRRAERIESRIEILLRNMAFLIRIFLGGALLAVLKNVELKGLLHVFW